MAPLVAAVSKKVLFVKVEKPFSGKIREKPTKSDLNGLFSNIFSVAILAAQCGSFLNGLILDNFGIFALRIAGTIYFLIAFGCLLFVPNISVLYWVGWCSLGLGSFSI